MTKEELEEYGDIIIEIEDLNKRIADMKKPEVVQFGTVTGSDKYFPYTPKVFHVAGIDPSVAKQREKEISELLRKIEVQRDEQVKKLAEIERFIANIKESRVRTIFRLHFIDGLSQQEIVRKVNYDQSTISRKIQKYLKDA